MYCKLFSFLWWFLWESHTHTKILYIYCTEIYIVVLHLVILKQSAQKYT